MSAPSKSPYEGEPYSQWAPAMWKQFEALGNNFKDSQSFAQGVRHLGSQIPCPECHQDFDTYVQSNPPENVKSKQQATQWVSAYHQHVNQVAGTQQGWGWGSDPNSVDVQDWTPGIMDEEGNLWTQDGQLLLRAGTPGIPGAGGGGGGGGSIGGGGGGNGGQPGEHTQPGPVGASQEAGTAGQSQFKGPGQSFIQGWDESDETWNTEMWSALHEAAEQFDPEDFAPFVYECIFNVPCEGCEDHSLQFAQEYPPEEVQSQEEALYWMCQFHNWASIDAGNGLVDCDSDPQGDGYVSGHDDGSQGFYYGGGGGSSGGSRGHGGQMGGGKGGHGHGGGSRMGGGRGGHGRRGGGKGGRHGHGGGMMQQQQQGMNGWYDYE